MRLPLWPGVRLSLLEPQNPDAVRVTLACHYKPLKVTRLASMRGWMILLVRYDWRDRGTYEPPAWSPPPPGSTREQLPDHLLALIDPPPYTSTACQTADLLADAFHDHLELHTELAQWIDRLHDRCRSNQKFTGQLCACVCHTDDPQGG